METLLITNSTAVLATIGSCCTHSGSADINIHTCLGSFLSHNIVQFHSQDQPMVIYLFSMERGYKYEKFRGHMRHYSRWFGKKSIFEPTLFCQLECVAALELLGS